MSRLERFSKSLYDAFLGFTEDGRRGVVLGAIRASAEAYHWNSDVWEAITALRFKEFDDAWRGRILDHYKVYENAGGASDIDFARARTALAILHLADGNLEDACYEAVFCLDPDKAAAILVKYPKNTWNEPSSPHVVSNRVAEPRTPRPSWWRSASAPVPKERTEAVGYYDSYDYE